MASILKAFNTIEKREMTISEYENYRFKHQHQSSMNPLECVECHDIIVYCNGSCNVAYFKHSPTHEGHGYCSLYREGKESKTCESLIRRKIGEEKDLTFNFELKYLNGSWKSLLTIPPFSIDELEKNTNNNTQILIHDGSSNIEILVDNEHFIPGELKKIGLNRFPGTIKIKIIGNSAKQDISYSMDGFAPSRQIYSSLILQNYIDDINSIINLRNVNMFVCKRVTGKVYTGRHYLIFSHGNYESNLSKDVKKDLKIIKIDLKTSSQFNFSIYDVVFNNVTEATEKFCSDRGCELVEKSDAVILWPPMNSIGNYKYYKKNSTKMFIAFENDSKTLEIAKYDTTKKIYFKVNNINATPFFVMRYNGENIEKMTTVFSYSDSDLIDLNIATKNYVFKNGLLDSKVDSGQIRLGKKDKLMQIKSSLERTIYQKSPGKTRINIEKLKNAIWYSKKYISFRNVVFEYLIEQYKDNDFIVDYLKMCKRLKKIKKAAIDLLMEA